MVNTWNSDVLQSTMWLWRRHWHPLTDQHVVKSEIIKRMREQLKPGPFSSSSSGLGMRLGYCQLSYTRLAVGCIAAFRENTSATGSANGFILLTDNDCAILGNLQTKRKPNRALSVLLLDVNSFAKRQPCTQVEWYVTRVMNTWVWSHC